jgi:NADH:ubiquinone oxidoreductase subunit 3 (subunit A)
MTAIHLLPPVAFVLVLGSVLLQSRVMDLLKVRRPKGTAQAAGARKPYASGEHVEDHRAQPDFGQFFHFAFFFTIVHVVALVVATVPRGSPSAAALAAGFLVVVAVGLFVLFRR